MKATDSTREEFNLLDVPWIRVMLPDCRVEERSLTDVLLQAQDYRRLAGELPTQDIAILRLLLAVLHTVYSRMDENGAEAAIETRDDALHRWKALWQQGHFSETAITGYLSQWRDRFWLFHPEHPFYQVPAAVDGTLYTAAKLNGELSESNHKLRLFPTRSGESKRVMRYGEAARWLVTINAFDDSSTKVGTGTGSGWLGQLGNLYASGDNLFETLLFNLVLLRDGIDLWEEDERPLWEMPFNKQLQKREIPIPENQAELLTLQSRRLMLCREDDRVVGYSTAGGDFFSGSDAFEEQMTLWRIDSSKKNQAPVSLPKRHDPERQMWRDFGSIAGTASEKRRPGVVAWLDRLREKQCIPRRWIAFNAVGVRYDGKGSSVVDVFGDHLDFNVDLLTGQAVDWVAMIERQVALCEQAVDIVGRLADGLAKAAGGDRNSKAVYAKEQCFYRIDVPFREWLAALHPDDTSNEASRNRAEAEWRQTAYRIVRQLGTEMVDQSGEVAFMGRWITETIRGQSQRRFYSSPKAYNSFLYWIAKCFAIKAAEEVSHEGSRESGQAVRGGAVDALENAAE